MTRLFRALVLAGLLAGCVNQYELRRQYMQQFVGRPESELILALGVPSRAYETGGVKFLAFNENRVEVLPGMAPYGPPWWGWGPGYSPQVVTLSCETTVAVRDGIVLSFVLRGNACR
jgi:hypothetical protein